MPIISVIVPVYKVEQYLDKCIASILAQTFLDFELILVDDGSPDNCPQICDEWAKKDNRITVIHKINGGVATARNYGLNIANGDYLTFCDSDDFWGPGHLNALFQSIVSNNADVGIANYIQIDENGSILDDYTSKHTIGITKISSNTERLEYLYSFPKLHGWECWSRLFKKDIIDKHKIKFPTTCNNYAEDMAFVYTYNLYATVITSIDCCEYYYRQRFDSMMHCVATNVKINEMNEISYWFYDKYIDVFGQKKSLEYSILHFLFMNVEYSKIIGTDRYKQLNNFISSIDNKKWYKKQTKNINKCYKTLKKQFGKRFAQQIILFSNYCAHRNWKRFGLETSIAYRYFIK